MAAHDEPATKAGYMKDYLLALRRLPPAKHGAVLEHLAPLVDEIEQASRSAWLPVSANLRVTEAVFRTLGAQEAEEFYAQWIRRQTETPVWSNLISGALTLFGLDPASLASWVPKTFDLMYRGYGRWTVQRTGDNEVTMELLDMPAQLATHVLWQRSVRSGMFALYRVTRVEGEIDMEPASAAHRCLRLVLHWRTKD